MSETTLQELESRIRAIVSAVTGVAEDRLGPDIDLIDTGIVDSMRALQIVNDLERGFDIIIPEEEVGGLTTIRAIVEGVALLNERQRGQDDA